MKRRLIPMILGLTLTLTLLLSGCSTIANLPLVGRYPLVLKDSYAREVTIPRLPERVISLAPSNTEIMFALGLGDKLVGVTDACNYPPEAEKIEKFSYQGPDMEKIIAAKPDLVLADSLTGANVVEQLQAAGIPVLAIRSNNIAQVLANIGLVGQATDSTRAADQLIAQMQARLQAVSSKLVTQPGVKETTVFYEVWNDDLQSIGPNTFLADVVDAAGGVSVTNDATTDWPLVNLESLIVKNPQVIILGHGAETPQQVITRATWQTIDAVKNGRVYTINQDIFNRPGPRVVDAVEQLARLLYPNLFDK